MTLTGARPVRAPRGAQLSCRGWEQEAVLRMLMNNLDPEVAEDPDNLVVYGGTRRAGRGWAALYSHRRAPRPRQGAGKSLIPAGQTVRVVPTHSRAAPLL